MQIKDRYYRSANYKGDRTGLSESDSARLKFLLRQNELDKGAISAIQNKAKVEKILAKNVKKTNEAYKEQIKAIKDTEDIAPYRGITGLEGFFEDPGLFDVFSDRGVDFDIIDPEDVEVLDELNDGIEELDELLENLGSPLANLSFAAAKTFKEIDDKLKEFKKSVNENLAQTLISAFESAATAQGNFFENLGAGMLSAIGSVLIQLGTASILAGHAKNGIVPGSGASAIKSGAAAVAGGIALKAGASAIGRGSSGASTTPGSRSNTSAPVSAFNSGNGGGTVTFEIGNDKLIGSLENGLRQRGTFLGTTSIN